MKWLVDEMTSQMKLLVKWNDLSYEMTSEMKGLVNEMTSKMKWLVDEMTSWWND